MTSKRTKIATQVASLWSDGLTLQGFLDELLRFGRPFVSGSRRKIGEFDGECPRLVNEVCVWTTEVSYPSVEDARDGCDLSFER